MEHSFLLQRGFPFPCDVCQGKRRSTVSMVFSVSVVLISPSNLLFLLVVRIDNYHNETVLQLASWPWDNHEGQLHEDN